MKALEVFRDKRILITGHTGFKGSWLASWLNLLGAEVSGYALPPERDEDHFVLLGLKDQIRHHEGDIRDAGNFLAVMKEVQPEFVFHLAAQSLVRRSYREPVLTFGTNLMGSVNVLEAIRDVESVRVLIYVTSDKCYKNKEWIWGYRENDELGGSDPYSASKASAEIAFLAYFASFLEVKSLAAASVRAGNVIGGGDWAEDRIVPDCIRALLAAKPIQVRNPEATRQWQHVLEPLGGYLLLASRLWGDHRGRYSGAWNFGSDNNSRRSVRELVEHVISEWGSGQLDIADDSPASPPEASTLHLNSDKARYRLGLRTVWNFEKSVQATVDWYRQWNDGGDARQLTADQIQKYTAEFEHILRHSHD